MDEQLLYQLEKQFGGVIHTTMREKSPHDPRIEKDAVVGKTRMRGGDRMLIHEYHKIYSQYLPDDPKVIVELGVLKGTGLAIWCDVYPKARVIGLDIDISHYDRQRLKELGAFSQNEPEVYKFDKLVNGPDSYQKIPTIDLMIDDAIHDTYSILLAFEKALPFMSEKFVYIIEDNREVDRILKQRYYWLDIHMHDKICIIRP